MQTPSPIVSFLLTLSSWWKSPSSLVWVVMPHPHYEASCFASHPLLLNGHQTCDHVSILIRSRHSLASNILVASYVTQNTIKALPWPTDLTCPNPTSSSGLVFHYFHFIFCRGPLFPFLVHSKLMSTFRSCPSLHLEFIVPVLSQVYSFLLIRSGPPSLDAQTLKHSSTEPRR